MNRPTMESVTPRPRPRSPAPAGTAYMRKQWPPMEVVAGWTYLDERLGSLQDVLPALGLRALLVPVYDRLIRDTILVVQNLAHDGQHADSVHKQMCNWREGN